MNKYLWTSKMYSIAALAIAVLLATAATYISSTLLTVEKDVLQLTASTRHPGIRLYDGRSIEQTFSLPAAANTVGIRVMEAEENQANGEYIIQISTEPEGEVVASGRGDATTFIDGYDQWLGIVPPLSPHRLYRLRISTEGVDGSAPLEIPADYEQNSTYPQGRLIVREVNGAEIVNRSGNIAVRFAYRFFRREQFLRP